MKFYALHRTHEMGNSAGFEFFATKRAAERAANEWNKDNPEEYTPAQVTVVEIEPTKQGILRALNLHASHPDNG